MDEELAAAKERSWREGAAIDAAYAAGELDEAGWYDANAALVVPAYLAAATPEGGSGSSRDGAGWEYARSLVADACEPGRTFLDIGCANGHLMQSMATWTPPRRFDVARTGLDYVPPDRRRAYVERLLGFCDRLVIGVHNEERDAPGHEEEVASWGFAIAGRAVRDHPHPRLLYKAFWIDA